MTPEKEDEIILEMPSTFDHLAYIVFEETKDFIFQKIHYMS